MKNVSCEYDRLNGINSTLQAAWYIYIALMTHATVVVYAFFSEVSSIWELETSPENRIWREEKTSTE